MPNLGSNRRFFVPCDLQIWQMALKNKRAPLLCYFKLCASFNSHVSIHDRVTVRKSQIWVKIDDFLSRVTLIFDGWPWKTIGHLFYAASSFGYHYIAIRKRLIWVLTYVALTFDLWPWPFAWISRLSLVITTENFMMMWWWEHSEKGVTNGQTNGRTDGRKKWS